MLNDPNIITRAPNIAALPRPKPPASSTKKPH